MSEKNTRASRHAHPSAGEKIWESAMRRLAERKIKRQNAPKPTKAEVIRRWKKATLHHAILAVVSTLLALLAGIYALLGVAFLGPSPTFSTKLTNTLLETSAMKWVPYLYLKSGEVQAIIDGNSVVESDEETDLSLIVIPTSAPAQEQGADEGTQDAPEEKDIEIFDVKGSTYTGYMMVVKDPSRVFVGTCADGFTGAAGLTLDKIAQRYDAAGAVNAGGFSDANGQGNGGTPLGLVISQKKLMANNANLAKYNTVIGFDTDNRLIIGKMTYEQAKSRKLRDAVAFGPALVVNGEAADITGQSSGLNPRTAIGQRADGAVLLLVIDGRQVSSLGASFEDLIREMLSYGAVNAANLDGGSSSLMYYHGKYLNEGFSIIGPREIPTAFVVQ